MAKSFNVAVVGATGAVGVEMLKTLEKRNFPVKNLKLLASERSVGKTLKFKGEDVKVEKLTEDSFGGVDIALFSAGASRSRDFAAHAVKAGAVVIDNSSAFRMDKDVPLIVPEVNPEDVKWHKGIISGAGAKAMEELRNETADYLAGRPVVPQVLPHPYAFNLFSHNTTIGPNGYCEEEMKMVNETRKIMHDDKILVCPTCIRVPCLRSHAEAITVEQERKVSVEEALAAFAKAPGVKIVNDAEHNYFPMPVDSNEQYDVLVGRVRDDLSSPNGLAIFVCGDQLLKGAALNAVQVAELL